MIGVFIVLAVFIILAVVVDVGGRFYKFERNKREEKTMGGSTKVREEDGKGEKIEMRNGK